MVPRDEFVERAPRQAPDTSAVDRESPRAAGSTRALAALCLLTLLWLPVMGEAAGGYGSDWMYPRPIDARGGLVGVLTHQKQHRMVNLILGVAARELADGELKTLIVPKKYRTLLKRAADSGPSSKVPAMQVYLLKRLTGDRLKRVRYNARASSAQFEALLAGPGVKAYPMNVYTVRIEGADHTRLVTITDPKRDRLALLPLSHSPIPVLR